MSARTSRRIDPAERLALERAVVEAREQSGAEIRVAVVGACDDYDGWRWRLGVWLAALALLGLGAFAAPLPLAAYLGAQGLALALGLALARTGPVLRTLVPPADLEARARDRADRIFAAQRDAEGGVLVFVALLERRVLVLAGEAARRSLAPGRHWPELVAPVREGLARDDVPGGLRAALAECAELLPPGPSAPAAPGPPRLVVLEDGPALEG